MLKKSEMQQVQAYFRKLFDNDNVFLKEHNFIIKDIPFRELSNYIFRFYRDNPEFSKQNSNVFISNIVNL